MDMNVRINRVKTIVRGDRFRFALIVAIPIVVIMGWIFANPFSPTAMPFQTTPRILQPSGQTIPIWLVNGADAGLEDKIRNAKRVLLYEPTAFNRIARIHQILSAYHSGLSVEDVERLSELIYQESVRYGYDPELIVSVILTESSFYNGALSRKGAIGLMQIKPVTGQELAEYNRTPFRNAKALFDPHLNIKLGIQYLALLHQQHDRGRGELLGDRTDLVDGVLGRGHVELEVGLAVPLDQDRVLPLHHGHRGTCDLPRGDRDIHDRVDARNEGRALGGDRGAASTTRGRRSAARGDEHEGEQGHDRAGHLRTPELGSTSVYNVGGVG